MTFATENRSCERQMSRFTVAEAAEIICEGADLADPELWVSRRLRAGVFSGLKIGRCWFMTNQDIDDALHSCRREAKAEPRAEDEARAEDEPAAPTSIVAGLSKRAQKLRAS